MSSLASFLLWLGVFADLLVLLFLLARLCRGVSSSPNREHTSLFRSPNRVKTFLSPGPSLVNTVAFTGLLRRVGLSLSCLSLENTLAVCEGRVPLDAVTGLCLLFLGLFFLSHDFDSENYDFIVVFFTNFLKLIRGETPRITIGCLLTPLVGWVLDCGIGRNASVVVERLGHGAGFTLLPSSTKRKLLPKSDVNSLGRGNAPSGNINYVAQHIRVPELCPNIYDSEYTPIERVRNDCKNLERGQLRHLGVSPNTNISTSTSPPFADDVGNIKQRRLCRINDAGPSQPTQSQAETQNVIHSLSHSISHNVPFVLADQHCSDNISRDQNGCQNVERSRIECLGTSPNTSISTSISLPFADDVGNFKRRRLCKINDAGPSQPTRSQTETQNVVHGYSHSPSHNVTFVSADQCSPDDICRDQNPPVLSGIPSTYKSIGKCEYSCQYCGALFWYDERLKSISQNDRHFMENIRAYNQMFSMTSLGANIDESINIGRRPYVFKISGQLYHWIGSLCPEEGEPPRFLQLYVYDTNNEVDNCMNHFGGQNSNLCSDIVEGLIELLDTHNALVQLFRTAREKLADTHVPNFQVRLYNVVGAHEYELPTGDMLGAIVYEPGPETQMDYDIIIEERTGRLFQQYVVTAFCVIEQNRIDYIREHQNDIRNEYLSGIYDAINRGDTDGSDCGGRLILPQSFTGGPRYMYSHYLDALAICRVHGNPSFFITFTCNVKWLEITKYMADFPLLTTTDRADIVDKVFEIKVEQFVKYLRDAQPFGKTVAVLYTIKFQKRGLPHCHTLLWIHDFAQVHRDEDIDLYISAELPSKDTNPECYRIVSELMMYGPCGLAYPSASCTHNGVDCKKHFPKEYCSRTYTDKDGFVHYRRRDTTDTVLKQRVELDNPAGNLFYQRMLLCHQKGCRSFLEIRKVNDIVYPTCRAACQTLGLLEDDQEWENTMKEAVCTATPAELQILFAYILTFCQVTDPVSLWGHIWRSMSEDLPYASSVSLNILNLHIHDSHLEDYVLASKY
ncbi:DNA helicase [Tanacetum coccineum]